MTNNRENIEERQKLVDIIGKDENWKEAYYIIENLKHIRWHVINNLFLELFYKLTPDSNIELTKKELTQITCFAHKERKECFDFERKYHGLPITIGLDGKSYNLKVTCNNKSESFLNFFSDENIFKLTCPENRQKEIDKIIAAINEKLS